jgi:protease I
MAETKARIAALVADAFQEEEYFLPKFALEEAGYKVDVISSRPDPVEIYSYFERTGLLDVDLSIGEADPANYAGALIPGGAKSPALLSEDPRVTRFVREVNERGGIIAGICRGSLLAAKSGVVSGRRMTGFDDAETYPDLVVQPDAEAAGATWIHGAAVVVDENLVTSPHPRFSAEFSQSVIRALQDPERTRVDTLASVAGGEGDGRT